MVCTFIIRIMYLCTTSYLQILQSKVDSFQPGRTPRSRKLTATLPRDCNEIVPECFLLVTLEGTIGLNQMRIKLDAFNPIESADQSVATSHPIGEHNTSISSCEFGISK